MRKDILFIGLGHLGRYFIDEVDNDYQITGTIRNINKTGDINKNIQLVPFTTGAEFPSSLRKTWSAVIISLPPHEGYKEKIKPIIEAVGDSPIIFISSTSVYDMGEVNETSYRDGKTPNAKLLIDIEDYLKTTSNAISIIRPGGLIDEKRSPANYLLSKGIISNSEDPVNIVHTRDVARFLFYMIKNKLIGEDYNIVIGEHPNKGGFYSRLIQEQFEKSIEVDNMKSSNKIIHQDKVIESGFRFKYNSALSLTLI